MQSGLVEAIYLGAKPHEALRSVEGVRAVAGQGLEGDRYFKGEGTFYKPAKEGQDLTLIEAEAIDGLSSENGIELEPGEARRNVVTRGVALNDLVGRRFRVGDVECVGRRLCDPCSHLESLTQPGVLKGLANRGGLRADILRDGWIAVGVPVTDLSSAGSL
jgi:MOSC domain-containing protein YiiM